MSRIKIDAVAARLSGHLYPVLLGFTVVPIMKNQMEQGFSFNASKMGFQL